MAKELNDLSYEELKALETKICMQHLHGEVDDADFMRFHIQLMTLIEQKTPKTTK